jgi:hypothetical protein
MKQNNRANIIKVGWHKFSKRHWRTTKAATLIPKLQFSEYFKKDYKTALWREFSWILMAKLYTKYKVIDGSLLSIQIILLLARLSRDKTKTSFCGALILGLYQLPPIVLAFVPRSAAIVACLYVKFAFAL